MRQIRARGEDVRRFILDNVTEHPSDIAKLSADHFGVSRQAVALHLGRLVVEGCLSAKGNTRNRSYKLVPLSEWSKTYKISAGLEEFDVWQEDIRDVLGKLSENVLDIWHYGFTEMFNNAIDHSDGTCIYVQIKKTASTTEILVSDDGIGIFEKIQTAMHLADPRHAVLELAKGKLTTDPKRHTGEGIFFTSRVMDAFDIMSVGVFFSHKFGDSEDWIHERRSKGHGTHVWMRLHNHTSRRLKQIFDQYVSGDDYGFTKTVVPVRLAQYGSDQLISRSQAKRVLARVELFKTVIFDFAEVSEIGPAFADEIFRVFASDHPEIHFVAIGANEYVQKMIDRARLQQAADKDGIAS